jgi:hypothetical protein
MSVGLDEISIPLQPIFSIVEFYIKTSFDDWIAIPLAATLAILMFINVKLATFEADIPFLREY